MKYESLAQRRLWAPSNEEQPGPAPAAIVAARDALAQFATRQLGLSLGLPRWSAGIQALDVKAPLGWQPAGPLAVLDLMQTPRVLLAVELAEPAQFTAWILRERPDAAEPGRPLVWKSAQAVILPADSQQLVAMLDKLLAEGIIEKRAEGLRFTGKRPSFRDYGTSPRKL